MKNLIALRFAFLLLSILIFGCPSKNNDPVSPSGNNTTTGETKTYAVTASSFIKDAITGYSFSASDEGSGNITITRVKTATGISESDSAFSVEYSGTGFAQIKIPISHGNETYLMGYTDYSGYSLYNSSAAQVGWLPIPPSSSDASSGTFILPLPNSVAKTLNNSNPKWSGISTYRVLNRGAVDKTAEIEKQIEDALDKLMKIVPDNKLQDIKTKKDGDYKHTLYVELSDRNKQPCYIPYMHVFKISISRFLRACQFVINFLNTNTTDKSVAHETGHHLMHMLMGSDYINTKALSTNHGIAVPGTRNNLIEELSYLCEYYLKGNVVNLNPEDPYNYFSGADPTKKDFPDLEGFLVMMAASIIRTNSTATNYIGDTLSLPVILPSMTDRTPIFKDMVGIFADGVSSITQFRQRIETLLVSKYGGADKFPALLQSIGWSYKIKCQLVDKDGKNIQGATARAISICSSEQKTYMLPLSDSPSDANGNLSLNRVYPGKNFIRFYIGKDSVDKEITLDYEKPTNVEIDLGKINLDKGMEASNKLSLTLYADIYMRNSYTGIEEKTSNIDFVEFYKLQNLAPKPLLVWKGNDFSCNIIIPLINTSDYQSLLTMSIKGNLNSTGTAIEFLEYSDTTEYIWPAFPSAYWKEMKHIVVKNLPLTSSYQGNYEFLASGAGASAYVEQINFEKYYKDYDRNGNSATLKLSKVNWNSTERIPELKIQFYK